jgi:predicted phosphate transport protein (TIGR00153 family)
MTSLKLLPREENFLIFFNRTAEIILEAAMALDALAADFTDVEVKARRIQEREHEGDEITHQVIQHLNTTFITPMDREDIYSLATALDDVLDAIEAAGDLFVLHNIEEPRPSMVQQAEVLVRAAKQTEEAVKALESLDREKLEPYWIEINSLENEGDRLYRRAIADMFSGDHRAMDVLKWREVTEMLEEALDGLENVANVVESVVLKHA